MQIKIEIKEWLLAVDKYLTTFITGVPSQIKLEKQGRLFGEAYFTHYSPVFLIYTS